MRYAFLIMALAISMIGAPATSSAQNLDGRVSAMIGLIATTAIAIQQQQNGRRPPVYRNQQSSTYLQDRYGRYDQSETGRHRAQGGVDNRYGGDDINRRGFSGRSQYDQHYANATGSQVRPRCWLERRQVMQGNAPARPRRLRVCED